MTYHRSKGWAFSSSWKHTLAHSTLTGIVTLEVTPADIIVESVVGGVYRTAGPADELNAGFNDDDADSTALLRPSSPRFRRAPINLHVYRQKTAAWYQHNASLHANETNNIDNNPVKA